MSIAAGLTATKAGLEVAKLLMDKLSSPEVNVGEVRSSVQEMLIHVVNAQVALGEAQGTHYATEEANRQLRREIEQLKESQAVTANLVFADEVYFKRKGDGTFDGPFCPACWDIDGKLLRLKLDGVGQYGGCPDETRCRKYDCIVHRIMYFIAEAKFNDIVVR